MKFMKKCTAIILCISMVLGQTLTAASGSTVDDPELQTVSAQAEDEGIAPASEDEGTALLPEEEESDALPEENGTALLSEEEEIAPLSDEEGIAPLSDEEGGVSTDWYDSAGTVFTLTTAAQLAGLAQLVNAGNNFSGKTVLLGADIDLSGREWTPIGVAGASSASSWNNPFKGTLNGQGHTVSGMTITQLNGASTYWGYGLVGAAYGATVQNLTVKGSITGTLPKPATSAYQYVGGVVGIGSGATVRNVISEVAVNVTASGNYTMVGGIMGGSRAASTILNSQNHGSVTLTDGTYSYGFIGGIAGGYYTNVINCLNTGSITNDGTGTSNSAGGILGRADSYSTLTNCLSTAASISAGKYPGLIVGYGYKLTEYSYGLAVDGVQYLDGYRSDSTSYVEYSGALTALDGAVTAANSTAVLSKDSYEAGETPLLYALNRYVSEKADFTLGLKAWELGADGVPAPTGAALTLAAPVENVNVTAASGDETGVSGSLSAEKGDQVTLTAGIVFDKSDSDRSEEGEITYQWYSAKLASAEYGDKIEGATEATYTFTAPTSIGKTYYFVEVTNTKYTTETGMSDLFTLNVLPSEGEEGWFGDLEDFQLKNPDAAPSAENPFLISTPGQLANLSNLVNTRAAFTGADNKKYSYSEVWYQQTAALDLNENDWTPIGTEANPFQGSYDGGNQKITNFFTNGVQVYVGLFGYVKGGEIKNLNVSGAIDSYPVSVSGRYMGAIAMAESAALSGLTVDITIKYPGSVSGTAAALSYVGGAAGYMNSGATLSDSTVKINMSPMTMLEYLASSAGGAVGYADTVTITGVTVSGVLCANAPKFLGGIVGYASASTVTDCVNKAEVASMKINSQAAQYRSGIVGYAAGGSVVQRVTNSGSVNITRDISKTMYLGGVVGGTDATDGLALLAEAVNTGDVTITDTTVQTMYTYVGGVIGYEYGGSTIANCMNSGAVTVNGVKGQGAKDDVYVGGVAGYLRNYSSTSPTTALSLVNIGAVTVDTDTTVTTYVGGVIGYAGYIYALPLINCANSGTVFGAASASVYAGGVTGRGSTLINCVNTGAVSGSSVSSTVYAYQLLPTASAKVENSFYLADGLDGAASSATLTGSGAMNSDGTVAFPEGVTPTYPSLTTAKDILNQYVVDHAAAYYVMWTEQNGALLPVGAVLYPAQAPEIAMSDDIAIDLDGSAAITAQVSVPAYDGGTTTLTYQWYRAPLGDTALGEKLAGRSGTVTLTGTDTLTGTITFDVPADEGGKTFYFVEVTNNVDRTADGKAVRLTAAAFGDFVSAIVREEGKYSGEVAEAFAGGSGTENDPYQIATEAQLAYLDSLIGGTAANTKYLESCYVLTADLDFNNQTFLPMGLASSFTGVFDGGGHTIRNLHIINASDATYNGFFAKITGNTVKSGGTAATPSVVKDLTLEGGLLEKPNKNGYVGAIAANITAYTEISNVHSSMTIDATRMTNASCVGGLVGMMGSDCLLENSSCSGGLKLPGAITGNTFVGGLVGQQDGANSVETVYGNIVRNCYYSGVIDAVALTNTASATTSTCYIGGLVGFSRGMLLNSANLGTIKAGDVSGSATYVSGLAGRLASAWGTIGNSRQVSDVLNCVNFGTVTASGTVTETHLNGIAAAVDTAASVGKITNSYSVPVAGGTTVYTPDFYGSTGMPGAGNQWTYSKSIGVGVVDLTTGALTPADNIGREAEFVLSYPRPSLMDEYTDINYALSNGASYNADLLARVWVPVEEGSIILVPTGAVTGNPLTEFTASVSGFYQETIAGDWESFSVVGELFDYNFGTAEDVKAPVLTAETTGVAQDKVCYQWYMSTTDGVNEVTTRIEGAVGKTYEPDMTLSGATQYYCEVVAINDVFGATCITDPITVSVRTEDGSWCGLVAPVESLNGTGTAADPYQIPDAETLALMAQLIDEKAVDGNGLSYAYAYWKLTADINLSGGHYWTPVTGSFYGILDGNGYAISNMKISLTNDSAKSAVRGGLFKFLYGAEIFDLTISGAQLSTDKDSVGGFQVGLLASYVGADTYIHDVTVKNSTIGIYMKNTTERFNDLGSFWTGIFGQYVGGLAGYTYSSSVIDSCDVDVDIDIDVQIVAPGAVVGNGGATGTSSIVDMTEFLPTGYRTPYIAMYVGGIAGKSDASVSSDSSVPFITNSTFSGNITAKSATKPTIWMGGIAGLGCNLVNDTVTGTLTTKLGENNGAVRMGGLVYSLTANGVVENCASTAALKLEIEDGYEGTRDVSLLAGVLNTGATVNNCWADSTVIGAGTVNVGAPDGSAAENLFYRVSAGEAELTGTETASAITTAEALVDSLNTWVYQASRLDETKQLRTWRAGGEGEAIAVLAGAPDLSQTGSVAFRLTGCTVNVAGEYETDENGAYIVPLGTAFTFTVRVDGGSKLTSIRSGDTDLNPVDGVYTVIVMGDIEIEIIAKNQTTIRTENIEDIITSVANGTQDKDDENSTYNPDLDFNDDGKNDLLDILDILYQQKAEQEAANASKEETPSETTPAETTPDVTTPDVTIEADETPKSEAPAAEALAADAPASEEQGE